MYFNILSTITVVFPDPGPATIKSPSFAFERIAFFWSWLDEMSLFKIFTTISSNSS